MSEDATHQQNGFEAAAHETLITTLRSMHALEVQVITVLEAQLDLLSEFPDLHARIKSHVTDTREQARRLEAGLEACGSTTSMVKDALMSIMGLGQSSFQGMGDDAVLKAMVADMMTEHLEIATYRTLLALADMAGKPELRSRLEESLHEEEAMAAWFDENLEAITRRFIEIKVSGKKADAGKKKEKAAAPQGNAERRGPDGEESPRTPWYEREAGSGSDTGTQPTAEPSLGTTPDKPTANPAQEPSRTTGG